MHRGTKQPLIWVIIPLVVLMGGEVFLFLSPYAHLAPIIGTFGTAAVIAVVITYIVAFDSRARWPGVKWQERLLRIFSFQK